MKTTLDIPDTVMRRATARAAQTGQTLTRLVTEEGRSMFLKLALRDLAVVATAGGVWFLLAGRSAGTGAVSDVTGVLAGLAVAAAGYVLHEWGHLAGAFAMRSHVTPGATLRSPFVFGFDAERNTLGQFLVMSFGGFLATGLLLWVCYVHLPGELLATRVARGGVTFLAALTVVLEGPLVVWGLVTGRVPGPVDVKPGGPAPAS